MKELNEFRDDGVPIGSPGSDMTFLKDANGKMTDVIRFEPGRRPQEPVEDEWLAMQSAPRGSLLRLEQALRNSSGGFLPGTDSANTPSDFAGSRSV